MSKRSEDERTAGREGLVRVVYVYVYVSLVCSVRTVRWDVSGMYSNVIRHEKI